MLWSGVGRAAIRATLQNPEARGIVLRHVDRGTFIAPNGTARPKPSGHQPSPAEIMASRLVLKPNLTPCGNPSTTDAASCSATTSDTAAVVPVSALGSCPSAPGPRPWFGRVIT